MAIIRNFRLPEGIGVSADFIETFGILESTSPNSGAIVSRGGVGVGNSLSIGGRLQLFNGNYFAAFDFAGSASTVYILPSSSPATGSSVLQSTAAGVMSWVPMVASSSSGSAATSVSLSSASTNATHYIILSPESSGSGVALSSSNPLVYNPSTKILSVSGLAITSNTPSSSSTTGALVVTGGVGIGDSLFVGSGINGLILQPFVTSGYGAIYSANVTPSTSNASFLTNGSAALLNGVTNVHLSIGAQQKLSVDTNTITIKPTTGTGSSASGALVVTGGAAVGQSLSIGGRLQIFNGANYAAFRYTGSGSTVYVLPTTSPATGSSVLQSDSTGVMTWVPMVASSSSGATVQNIVVNNTASANLFHQVLLTPFPSSSGSAVSSDSTIVFNPSTEILYVSGLAITATTVSTTTSNGALQVTGGVGIGGSLYVASATAISGVIINNGIITGSLTGTATTAGFASTSNYSYQAGYGITAGIATTATYSHQSGYAITSGLSGSATTAFNVNLVGASTNSAHQIVLSPSSSGSGVALSSNTTLSYNPSSNILSTSGLAVTAGTSSSSTSTGALIVSGGVGIGGTLFVGTTISVNSGTSGLLLQKLVGGNYGAIYSSGVTPSATNYTMITDGTSVNFNGTGGVYFNISNTNKIQVTTNNINIVPTASSTSTSTGAFTVAGGVGIGGSLYVASATAISGVTINNGVIVGNLTGIATTATYSNQSGYGITAGFATTSTYSHQSGYAITSGIATTATNINTVAASTNATHYLLFSPVNGGSGVAVSSDTGLTINPASNTISLSTLSATTVNTSTASVSGSTASTSPTTGALVVTGGVGIGGSLYVAGDLTINGTTTTINSVTLTVDDKNIELGSVNSPSDVTAEGGGITLKGATDKFINWYTGTGWSSSESWNLVSGNTYKINNTTVLSNSSLGTGVTNSSLTALGTISTGVWAGTLITALYGGTGYNSYSKGDLLVGAGTTLIKFGVGSDNQLIIASSSSGAGLTWATFANPTYGSFYSTSTQQVSGAGISTPIKFNATYESNRVSIYGGSGTSSRIQIQDPGPFSITFSAQINLVSGNQPQKGDFWFRVNGQDIPKSNSQMSITGKDYETLVTVNFVYTFALNDYFEVVMSSSDPNFSIEYQSGLTSPPRPDVPSIILSVIPITHIVGASGSGISGILSLNGANVSQQYLLTGTSGNDFNITTALGNHTFNIPIASTGATGLLSSQNQTIGGIKTFASGISVTASTASTSTTTGAIVASGGVGIGGSLFIGGTITSEDNVVIKTAKEVRFNNSGNTFYTGFKAGANTANNVYTLPIAYPGTGTSILQSDISGVLTWVAMTASSGAAGTVNNGSVNAIPYYPSAGAAITGSSSFTNVGTGISILYSAGTSSTSTGALVITGGVGIGQSVSVGGRLQMFNGANYTAFVSSATGNTLYTLPATSPATGSSVLQSTSAGVMSWVPLASVGNTIPNIVVNNAGSANVFHSILFTPSSSSAGSAVSSDSTITFNPSTEILSVSGLAVTSGTASTNTTTGALVVRGGLGVTGQLSFASASFGFTGISSNPSMSFIGATTSSPITLTVLTDNSLNFEGSQGSVFSIDSNLSSGEIFSVSDISGLPIISASAGQTVNINEFGGYTQIGNGSINSSSTSTGSLVIVGGLGFTGNAFIGGTTTISNGLNSSSTTSGSLVVRGGLGITGNAFIGGTTTITNGLNSSSTSSGSLVVNGGVGITGNAFIGGTTSITNGLNSSSTTTGSLTVIGGFGITGNAFIGGTVNITNTTLAGYGSTTTGALVVAGGVGIGGSVYIGGQIGVGGTLDYNAPGNVAYFAGNNNSYTQVIVHNHNSGNSASSDFIVSNDSTTDTTFFGDFGMNSSGWAATTSAYNTANAVYLASNSGDLAIGSLTSNAIRFFYNNGVTDIVTFGATAATIYYGTNSSSTTSGALQINGGLGITGNAFIGGTTYITNGTNSVSTGSGSLVVNGGLGVTGNAFIGGTTYITNGTNSGSTGSGSLVVNGGLGITGNAFIGGTTTITNLTNSTTTGSGSLVLNGGLGVSANANIGGTVRISNGLNSSSTTSGSLIVNGGLGITGNAFIGGTTSIINTTASTSIASGALTVSGGVGIGQTLFVGGSISNANYFYSGGNNFTKSGQAQGDILLDNNSNDTPGVLYYYKNNTNFGTDVFATGAGTTRYRIVKDLNESGGAEIWSIDRTGVVTRTAWDVGEVINTRVYNYSDLNMSATTTINSTTYTNVATITYTQKSSTSYLWIEFDANYDFSNGTTTDDFFSRITVGGSVISERNQIFVGQIGGGTRSGVIFPISGRYTNSATSGIAITVQARYGSSDDPIRVYGSTTSGYMRIQEIGR